MLWEKIPNHVDGVVLPVQLDAARSGHCGQNDGQWSQSRPKLHPENGHGEDMYANDEHRGG